MLALAAICSTMRLLLVFISINVFCQPPAKNLMSKGQMNATQFLLSTFGDEDFKKHIRVDTARNSMTFFKDGEFLRLPQTTQTDEKIPLGSDEIYRLVRTPT